MTLEYMEVDLPQKFASKLTKDAFVGWLQDRPPGKRVGMSDSASECPLALFIRMRLGFPYAQVACGATDDSWDFRGACMTLPRLSEVRAAAATQKITLKAYRLPKWADKFVDKVDTGRLRRAVSPREALSILGRIK